ncbi:MAG: aminotransferase class I/II-fold pyridoxal phosphate-dependent enzyme, partial [Nitrospirales bacterium]
MAYHSFQHLLQAQLEDIRATGLFKGERQILGPQGAHIRVAQGEVINLCANNYLELANHPQIIHAAQEGLRQYGFGMASVRFICGTQDQHKQLEEGISQFLGTEDTILYSSCFDANTGLFETILSEQDAVISDALNHASLIDGIRLCKAKRFRYAHSDMHELEGALQQAAEARVRLIATDGVFSMDGDCAKLDRITELAEQYDAVVLVDDSHATGVLGRQGKGTPEHFGVADRVDIL